MQRLENRIAIVTGGAQGIGQAIAERLASEGAAVAILDIQEEKAAEVARAIEAGGGQALAVRMDITDGDDVKRAVRTVEEKFGRVDILVNNAGWDKGMPFIELPEDICDRIIAINLRGQIAITRAVLDGMISRKYGKIVNISSDAGRVGSSGEAVYSACKGGLIALTKTLARELVRYGINVNAVSQGPADTPFIADLIPPKLREALEKSIPMRRLAKPDDIAPAVAFLASDEAGYIIGQTLSVSGGLTMI